MEHHFDKKDNTSEVVPGPTVTQSKAPKEKTEVPPKKTRELYGPNEHCYVMDAKSTGNIGRYLNVSLILLNLTRAYTLKVSIIIFY